jgi:hypothetical protein
MAVRACIERGCGEYTTGTRCAKHEAERRASMPSTKATQTPDYKADRAAMVKALKKRGFLICSVCGEKITTADAGPEGLEAHHLDGADVSERVVPAHRTCHRGLPPAPPRVEHPAWQRWR